MANETTNIGLRKPVPTENFDIDRDFNTNWDKIDEELGNLEAGVENTYTKDEVDAKDGLKADKDDTYTKTEVDAKDELKADLSEIETARGTEATLGERLDSTDADYEALTQDYAQHKLDYTEQRSQDQLKVAKVEKDINDYQSTMANVNVNQEAKQNVTGHGVVSLPKNSANGQVGASIKGKTRTNLLKTTELEVTANVFGEEVNLLAGITYVYSAFIDNPSPKASMSLTIRKNDNRVVTGNPVATQSKGYSTTIFTPTETGIYQFGTVAGAVIGTTVYISEMLLEEAGTRESFITGTKSTISASRLKSVGKNLFDKSEAIIGYYRSSGSGKLVASANILASDFIEINNVLNFTLSGHSSGSLLYYASDKSTYLGNTNTVPQGAKYVCFNGSVSDIDTMQLEEGTVATPYEPYTESTQYLPNVGELRSLPNGVKDEIRVSGGKAEHVKRVSDEIVVDGSRILAITNVVGTQIALTQNQPYPNAYVPISASDSLKRTTVYGKSEVGFDSIGLVENVGKYNYHADGRFRFIFNQGTFTTLQEVKDYFTSNPLTLIYQLAEPIITPINVSGALLSNPSGTVYVENVVADAGIYTNKFDIKELQLPIKSIDKLIKYDFETGVQTVLDTSLAVVNADKKSFTHPKLTKDDMVFVDYFYDVESTLGETTIEYLDSRHTIKDSVNNKFYKWDIKSTNGVPTVELTEVL